MAAGDTPASAATPSGGVATAPATRTAVLVATILASSMAFIDGTVVTIALPAIQGALDASFEDLQWVVNAYGLMLGALILVAGGLGDRVGRRRIFVVGLLLFTTASLVCALAGSATVLIGARTLQGIGAALLIPQSLAIISATFPRETRGRAIGTWAAASAITTALGPPLGGLLIDWLSWRAAFWINLPLAAVALWLTITRVPETRDETGKGSLDWAGALAAILSFGLLTYGLTGLSERAANGGLIAASIALGLAGLATFVWLETRVQNPVMPPSLFRSRVFAGTNIVTVFLYGCFAGAFFLLPFDLIARRGLTAAEAGLTMMPVGIIIGLGSRAAGALADRIGPRPFLIIGPTAVSVACALLALGIKSYWLGALIPVMILAAGMAAVVSPLTTAVMNSVPESKVGTASGINNAASRVAGLLAVAILGALASLIYLGATDGLSDRFGVLPAPGDATRPALEAAFVTAYSAAMWVAAAWAAIAAGAAWLWLDPKAAAGARQ